jgi:hypothetical protein
MTTAQQLEAIDSKTGRTVTWNIEAMSSPEANPNLTRYIGEQKGAWTHHVFLSRPRGRGAIYAALVVVEDGAIVRSSGVWKVW